MVMFAILFFIVIFTLLVRDVKITIQRQNNPKYFPNDTVLHTLSGGIFKILKQATQNEIKSYYPAFSYRPYSAYWLKIVTLKNYNEDITLYPIAESMLRKLYN